MPQKSTQKSILLFWVTQKRKHTLNITQKSKLTFLIPQKSTFKSYPKKIVLKKVLKNCYSNIIVLKKALLWACLQKKGLKKDKHSKKYLKMCFVPKKLFYVGPSQKKVLKKVLKKDKQTKKYLKNGFCSNNFFLRGALCAWKPLLRGVFLYQIWWIFGKLPNGLWHPLPPSFRKTTENYVALFFGRC